MPQTRTLWVDENLKKDVKKLAPFFKEKRWTFATDAAQANAFLYSEGAATSINILEVCGVKPLILFQPHEAIPEFSLKEFSQTSILNVLDEIAPICDKLAQLGDTLKDTCHDAFYAGLVFLWSRGKVLDPLLDTQLPKGYGYLYFDTVVYALNPRISLSGRDIFEYLEESSLVEAIPFEIAHICPKCESILLLLRDSCLNCGSPHVHEEVLVHHFSCGFQGSESNYQTPNEHSLNEYVCPKCKKPLRHFGLDYDKPGVIYHCNDCLHDNGDTEVYLKCLSCNHVNKAEQSKRITIHSYKLSHQGQKVIASGDSSILNVKNYLKEHISLIPFDTFLLLLKKISGLRNKSEHAIMMIHFKEDYFDVSSKKLLVEIGKSLSRYIREGDSVSFYQGTLFVMFLDVNNKFADDFIKIKKDKLKDIFKPEVMNLLEFQVVEGDEFLSHHKGIIS